MLKALAILLLCQLCGEALARSLQWPLPGPVIGLVLLLTALFLATRRGWTSADLIDTQPLGQTANSLLGVLGILFVPAGVGVIQHLELLSRHGMAIVVALLGSTLLTLIVTVWVFLGVARLTKPRP